MSGSDRMNFGAFWGNAEGDVVLSEALEVKGNDITITSGKLNINTAASQIVPGATSFAIRNNANSANNVLVSDAGAVTVRAGLTITASGLTVTAGGLTVTASGITVTDGGVAIRGSARLRESMSLTADTTIGNLTLTAAMLVGGLIRRDPSGAARTDTTDTGTAIEAELNAQGIAIATDDTFICWYINTADAAETITLAGGVGVTIINPAQTIAQNESALLLFRRTAANTFSVDIVGA